MILSMENFPFRAKFGEEEAFRLFKEAGFEGVDYSFNNEDGSAIELDDHIQKAKETKRLLDKYDLICNQAHAPFEFKYGDEFTPSNKNFYNLIRTFEYGAIIGTKAVVVHAIKVPNDVDFLEYNYNYYKALEPYAKKAGVKIAVENLLNSIFWLPAKLSGFIKLLVSDVFCACIDVGHSAIVGVAPENYISGMNSDMIQCVHLHDTDNQIDRHWIPYQGNHNWDNIIRALSEYGFSGDINLEVIHSFDNVPDELLPDILNYVGKVGKYLVKKFKEYK